MISTGNSGTTNPGVADGPNSVSPLVSLYRIILLIILRRHFLFITVVANCICHSISDSRIVRMLLFDCVQEAGRRPIQAKQVCGYFVFAGKRRIELGLLQLPS